MANEAQKLAIFRKVGYKPSPEQWKAHADTSRIKLVAGGERAGKSTWAARELISQFWEGNLYWIVAKDYEMTRSEFSYIAEDAARLGILKDISFPSTDQCHLVIEPNIEVFTKSLRDPHKIAATAPNGIIIAEVAQIDYESWLRLLARVMEKRGWIAASGTFEGSLGWYPEKWNQYQIPNSEDGKSFSLPSWVNKAIYPGGRNDAEILRAERFYPQDKFLERFGGVPCAPSNVVIPEFKITKHVTKLDWDNTLPIYLWIDPGFGGAYAVEAIQISSDIIYVIDEIYLQGYTTEEIIDIVVTKPWWKNVVGGVIDIAAKQHQAMPAPVEIWRKKTQLMLKASKIEEELGIERLRNFLKLDPVTQRPRMYFNETCRGFMSECGGCPSPVSGGGIWLRDRNTGRPERKNNHACKALIYGLVDLFGYVTQTHRYRGTKNYLKPRQRAFA